MGIILLGLDDFPNEAAIIGRMLVGYGELEYNLLECLGVVLVDHDTALKALFRGRGEEYRIQVADAFMRPRFEDVKLKEPYEEAISDLSFCRQIRNQYAHAHFDGMIRGKLTFVDLEKAAKTNKRVATIKRTLIPISLLRKQEDYFGYVQACFLYLSREYEVITGKRDKHDYKLPRKVPRPPLDSATP